jgi:hypothetical protein
VIAVLKKDRFTPISALLYVVRETDNHRPASRAMGKIKTKEIAGIGCMSRYLLDEVAEGSQELEEDGGGIGLGMWGKSTDDETCNTVESRAG